MQQVFIIGAKSLGAYGGYETFVYKLTEYHKNETRLRYHVACKANGTGSMDERLIEGIHPISKREFSLNGARCFKIKVPPIGPASAVIYDIMALSHCCRYIKKKQIDHPVVYILACRIGPFIKYFCRKIHRSGGLVLLNPDGHEWQRGKWSLPVRQYWRWSERQMVRGADLIVCDSKNIETYIREKYAGLARGGQDPLTTYIAYGAEIATQRRDALRAPDLKRKVTSWYHEHDIRAGEYYLVVGRLVPENNYETMIREFMRSSSPRDLVLITNNNEKIQKNLDKLLGYKRDPRIKFVGSVYDQELLQELRSQAAGYLHGHEVGGTNPSLLEALGSTELNLLLDVSFNREVAEDVALYWTKTPGSLAKLIEQCDEMDPLSRKAMGQAAKARIASRYSWSFIASEYQDLFLKTSRKLLQSRSSNAKKPIMS